MSESDQSLVTVDLSSSPFMRPIMTDSITMEAHQPKNFKFPKQSFGKKTVVNCSFQSSWFEEWNWLQYIENDDAVVCCITCMQASAQKKLQWCSNLDLALI